MMEKQYTVLGHYQNKKLRITHEVRPPEFEGPQKACHPDAVELSVVTHGVTDALLGSASFPICAGLYGIVPAGVVHSSWTKKGVTECNIHLPNSLFERAFDDAGIRKPRSPKTGPFPVTPELNHMTCALIGAVDGPQRAGSELLIESLCLSLCAWIVGEHQGSEPKPGGTAEQRRVRHAEEWMRSSPDRNFTVDELARAAKMSRFQFLRAFKKEFGLSPYAYLLRLRVERSVDLIVNTDFPLTRIAFDLGFSSSGRFTDAFKRVYGHPPSLLRTNRKDKKHDPCIPEISALIS